MNEITCVSNFNTSHHKHFFNYLRFSTSFLPMLCYGSTSLPFVLRTILSNMPFLLGLKTFKLSLRIIVLPIWTFILETPAFPRALLLRRSNYHLLLKGPVIRILRHLTYSNRWASSFLTHQHTWLVLKVFHHLSPLHQNVELRQKDRGHYPFKTQSSSPPQTFYVFKL